MDLSDDDLYKEHAAILCGKLLRAADQYPEKQIEIAKQLIADMCLVGFFVRELPQMHEHFAIIDREIVWFGSMNLLSRAKEESKMYSFLPSQIQSKIRCQFVHVVPYMENEITREEFDEMMKEKTDGAVDSGLTYEQYMEQQGKIYAAGCTLIFNQDGEELQPMGEYRGRSVNAVQGKEISKLYIYIYNDLDAWMEMYEKGIGCDAADQALISAEVEVK